MTGRSLSETSESALNPEARERERLRREARKGVCPVCGRMESTELEHQINQYAQANARLHAGAR